MDQNFFRLDLPELNLFLVIVLGLNLFLELVLFTLSSFVMPKTWCENDKNHKIWVSYISYMSPLNKMLAILFYQLFVPNKKVFLQFLPQRPLNATFGHPFFGLVFPPVPPSIWLAIMMCYGDIEQFHLTRTSFLCLIYDKMLNNSGIKKILFWFMTLE